jgi:hypothetical protein
MKINEWIYQNDGEEPGIPPPPKPPKPPKPPEKPSDLPV